MEESLVKNGVVATNLGVAKKGGGSWWFSKKMGGMLAIPKFNPGLFDRAYVLLGAHS